MEQTSQDTSEDQQDTQNEAEDSLVVGTDPGADDHDAQTFHKLENDDSAGSDSTLIEEEVAALDGTAFDNLGEKVRYIGTKISHAIPMTRLEYVEFRGWGLPENERGSDKGYIVQYADGYISWSPAAQFEEAYRATEGLSFGMAIEAMKHGFKVQRAGWNGKGMFCIYVPGTKDVTFKAGTPYAHAFPSLTNPNGEVTNQEILPHFDMYTINAEGRKAMLPGWLASQSDMAADDWSIVD